MNYSGRWDYDTRRWLAIKLGEKDREIERLQKLVDLFYEQQLTEIRLHGT